MDEEKHKTNRKLHAKAQITVIRWFNTDEVGLVWNSFYVVLLCETTNFDEEMKKKMSSYSKNSQDILPILSQFQYHIRRMQFIVSDFY